MSQTTPPPAPTAPVPATGSPGATATAAAGEPERTVTSPLFFAHERLDGQTCALGLATGTRMRSLSARAFQLLQAHLAPRTTAQSEAAGFSRAEREQALAAGLLVDADAPTTTDMFRWEDSRWSRAAYLLYSQQDLPYTEPVDGKTELSTLSDFRREQIAGFQSEAAYPERFRVDPVAEYHLPVPEQPITYSLDAMLARRSVRKFAATGVDTTTLGALLHHATANVRMAEDSKAGNDPYYLLNSFYTWLHLYVVVQGVEGVPRGVYQYDFARNSLLATGAQPTDEEIASVIQGQNWIGGGGISVFVTVQWDRYQWLYRHSRAYLNLLIQTGEFAQELLQAGYQLGLTGWLTPAVAEGRAASLLGLDRTGADADAIYYLKLGYAK
ncbi:nitroreductase family protein [Streptomyces antimicrobicus]|uniref:Nitroreductase family protein n=1 Tax=Streptomyces antimicrobicus TaxID=2883108 RepID=A0ABS8B324_9ACTN|nr:nitroreductase family protein [Streptomyces antimicrobicus]MCB5179009.1 nitroreductase family protein [Streptomyces antimicrobicus]